MHTLQNFLRPRPVPLTAGILLLLTLLFLRNALTPPAGQVMGGYDMRGYYFVLLEAARDAVHNGRLPLWTPYMFNGSPLLADPQMGFFYPPTWPALLLPVNTAISLYWLFHIWLAGMGMFLFTRAMGARPVPALLAATGFAFSGLLAGRLWAGHMTVYAVDAWAGWILLATLWAIRRGGWSRALLAGLPLGLSLLAGHLPSFLYIALLWALFVLYLAWTGRSTQPIWQPLTQAGLMLLAGLGLAAVQLLPFIQFSLQSARVATADFNFATDYSLPPAHLVTLVLPLFFGEPAELGYWSVPTFEELAYYAGLLPLWGLVLALRRPSRLTAFYLLLIVLGLWLALGRYGGLYALAYDWLPPFQLVRGPARAAFLYLFAVLALLAHALTTWQTGEPDESGEPAGLTPLLRAGVAVLLVAATAAIIATGTLFALVHPTDTSGRLWHQLGGYALALLILLLAAGLLWAYLRRPGQKWIAAALLALVVVDMWFFAGRMVRLEPVGPDPAWREAQAILGESTPRILPWGLAVYGQNGGMQTRLPSLFGYSSLEPAAHIALAASVPDPRSRAYDILAARYVLAETPLDQYTEGDGALTLREQRGAAWLYDRPDALPVARLVSNVEIHPDPAAAVARIHQPDFDPATTLILSEAAECTTGTTPAGTAQILETQPGFWRIHTTSDQPTWLVLAENAYPGWQATIDGQPTEWHTAYTTLRALCVPAGDHNIEWTFRPRLYTAGAAISLVFAIAQFIALLKLRRTS